MNHRRRIIQHSLLTEYAHFLAIGGVIYTITDVKVTVLVAWFPAEMFTRIPLAWGGRRQSLSQMTSQNHRTNAFCFYVIQK